MRGRFNVFQSAMLRWRTLHPYNAVHAVSMRAPFDTGRLQRAVDEVLGSRGLTGFAIDPRRKRYHWSGGPARAELAIVAGGADPRRTLDDVFEDRLNAVFPAGGRYEPFRFFAVTGEEEFHLGVAYDHVIAGGDSIAALLGDIVTRYAPGDANPPKLHVLERYPGRYRVLFAHRLGALLRGLPRLTTVIATGRRSIRPRVADAGDGRNGFRSFAISGERYLALRQHARAMRVSVNDLMIAIVLQSLAQRLRAPETGARRNLAALASIVNLRDDYQPDVTRTFGQFLSSFRVMHPAPVQTALAEVARALHRQSVEARSRRLYLQTLLVMAATAIAWRFQSAAQRQRFYFKYHPVLAGVTPLNVTGMIDNPVAATYLRAASTGPVAPMVFALTTRGPTIQVGLAFRSAAVTPETVEATIASVCRSIDSLCASAPPVSSVAAA